MMTQKLITDNSLTRFKDDVNNYLAKGWRVIPSTLVISQEQHTVVLEKDYGERSLEVPMSFLKDMALDMALDKKRWTGWQTQESLI